MHTATVEESVALLSRRKAPSSRDEIGNEEIIMIEGIAEWSAAEVELCHAANTANTAFCLYLLLSARQHALDEGSASTSTEPVGADLA